MFLHEVGFAIFNTGMKECTNDHNNNIQQVM